MWSGVMPAVTTKFTDGDELDHAEMERCFALLMEAGCDGLIACGSLGEGPMLSHDEKLSVFKTMKGIAGRKPALLTINEAATLLRWPNALPRPAPTG
jgi:4-hydroxy-tetrahydrodipicolinate synthase